ncbi:MAG: leucine-rich repeat protein, partial [Alphaproteobacteria bacterium]|nr:leucine-rich repeat protein [Alphaproteobacteria bacterium]
MKRILILALFALSVSGQSIAAPSYDYDEENKVLTISGTGSAGNGGYTSATSVVVGDGVTSLGSEAFMGTALESVTFAEGSNLQTIAQQAFAGTNITSIDIPD